MKKDNPLKYYNGDNMIPKDCKHKISPSQFSKFINKQWQWYREQILKEEGFTYSTSSVIGSVVHFIAEQVAKGDEIDKASIEDYIDSHAENDDFNSDTVRNSYPVMAEVLVNDYVMENRSQYLEVEPFKIVPLGKKYYLGGSLDAIQGTRDDCLIVDYKTYNSKSKPKSIPSYYKHQLLVYAYLLSKLGFTVSRVRLVYINRQIDGGISEKTGKPLKSYYPEVTVLTESIDSDDFDFIEGQINLCIDTCEASDKYPELRSVIWHDPRLKD